MHAPGNVPAVAVGRSRTIPVDVVNNGPAASPGTRLTIAPPPGARVTGLTWPGGTCDAASLQCDVGVVRPGTTVPVSVTLVGVTPGDAPFDWSVTGAVQDPLPSDNAVRTVVPVREDTPPPTTTPQPPTPTRAPPTTEPPPPPHRPLCPRRRPSPPQDPRCASRRSPTPATSADASS